jgi:hypothetical protein
MNTELTTATANPEITVQEGITALLKSVEATQREAVLLQSQCVGNPKLADILQSSASLINAMSVYSSCIIHSQEKLLTP